MKKNSNKLREGFTTGSAATAAGMAALTSLLSDEIPTEIDIPLPVKGSLVIPIDRVEVSESFARGVVIKDGGDDPDATHREEIHAVVELFPAKERLVELSGGIGVGKVTLPGLPVKVGEAAINPAPRKQIIAGILQQLASSGPDFNGTVKVRIEVPNGEKIAEKTMNARLGILGGISILGTQGIVRPFSHASWKASIAEALSVARASSLQEVVFTTGRRSEKFYIELFPDTELIQMVQAADFFQFSMQQAKAKKIKRVRWAIFIGKLVKHAQGFPYTHAKDWAIDFPLLAKWCSSLGIEEALTKKISIANTARQVFEMISDQRQSEFVEMLVKMAKKNALNFARDDSMKIEYCLFDFDGNHINKS